MTEFDLPNFLSVVKYNRKVIYKDEKQETEKTCRRKSAEMIPAGAAAEKNIRNVTWNWMKRFTHFE